MPAGTAVAPPVTESAPETGRLVGDRGETPYAVHRPDCAAWVIIACDEEGQSELLP